MNKILAWLPAAMILGIIAYKPVKEARETKLVNKDISVSVYKSSDYTTSIYNSSSAQVHVTIEKVTSNGLHTIVWDKVYDPKNLSDYPTIGNALKQRVIIPNVDEKREYLIVHCTLDYNTKGNQILMHEATVINDTTSAQVEISI